MSFKKFILKPWVLIMFAAILSALPFTFENLFLLSWVSFVPLFYVIVKHPTNKLRIAFGRGFLFGFLYHICIYYWFLWFFPLEYVGLSTAPSIAVVCLAWFGISAVHGFLWGIPFLLSHFIKKINNNPFFVCFAAIVGILIAQKLTSLGELSFPWTHVSLGQYIAPSLIQIAAFLGIDGVDMLLLWVNALIAICITSKPKEQKIIAASAIILFLVNLVFGYVRISTVPTGDRRTVMTVQASVDSDKKWSLAGDIVCYDIYTSLTKENITPDVQMVLWPESAVPTVYHNNSATKKYSRLAKKLDVPVIVGIIQHEYGSNTNDAFFTHKNGDSLTYSKRQLVPFGEYMPYSSLLSLFLPVLTDLNIIENDYIAGNSSAVMQTEFGNIGNIICFESIYPKLSRDSTLDGAEILFELTNDSWLKDSPAMKQHLAHGVFRSVENGRFIVRSANSGISAVIDSRGRIVKQLGVNKVGTLTETVQLYDNTTLYTKMGDVLIPFSLGILTVLTVIFIIKRKNNQEFAN